MPFSSSWSLMKCIANKQTLPYWKLGVDGIMRIANMCSLPMVFFLIQILNKRALLSRNEICRKYALFRIFLTQIWLRQLRFDSDFTQTSVPKNGDWSLCCNVQPTLSLVQPFLGALEVIKARYPVLRDLGASRAPSGLPRGPKRGPRHKKRWAH